MKSLTDQADFNKNSLRKLAEQYLATTILQNDILGFLRKNISLNININNLLADRAGKSANSIYKNINQLSTYNAISLLRYWQAMTSICKEFEINEKKIPDLNSLLLKYDEILCFINHITTEDQVEVLIKSNFKAILEIIVFYKSHGNSITTLEIELLQQLSLDPLIYQKLSERDQHLKESILERMKKK